MRTKSVIEKRLAARAADVASRLALLAEENCQRWMHNTMTRQQMRGGDAVTDDLPADGRLVQHLGTINYGLYLQVPREAPDQACINDSRRGYWRYSLEFLLEFELADRKFRRRTDGLPGKLSAFRKEQIQSGGSLRFGRTNSCKSNLHERFMDMVPGVCKDLVYEWEEYRAYVLQLLLVDRRGYWTTNKLMRKRWGFEASLQEYRTAMEVWKTLAEEDDDPLPLPKFDDEMSETEDEEEEEEEGEPEDEPEEESAPESEADPESSKETSKKRKRQSSVEATSSCHKRPTIEGQILGRDGEDSVHSNIQDEASSTAGPGDESDLEQLQQQAVTLATRNEDPEEDAIDKPWDLGCYARCE
jgi:hypothetical protein